MSAYVPIDFEDGVTPLNEATFDHLEAGIVALDAVKVPDPTGLDEKWLKAESGAMVWVDAPTGGGGSIEYENVWAPATAYQAGDVVNYQGAEYLAVNPSTGQTPPAAALGTGLPDRLGEIAETITDWNNATKNGWFMAAGATNAPTGANWYIGRVVAHLPTWVTQEVWDFTLPNPMIYRRFRNNGTWGSWFALGPAVLVTALPTNTIDGYECILTDSLTAPNYQWRLRYVAAKASNKWVFIGGAANRSVVATQESVGTSYGDPATPGPDFTIPATGLYEAEVRCIFLNTNTGSVRGNWMSYAVGAGSASDDWAASVNLNASAEGSVFARTRLTATGGDLVRAKFKTSSTSSGGGQPRQRELYISPVAIGG